jgi:hypothetical protein
MSLAIVLGGWTAASILLSPLIGRFLAGREGEGRYGAEPCRNVDGLQSSFRTGPRHAGTGNMRRNVATQLHRREAGWSQAVH